MRWLKDLLTPSSRLYTIRCAQSMLLCPQHTLSSTDALVQGERAGLVRRQHLHARQLLQGRQPEPQRRMGEDSATKAADCATIRALCCSTTSSGGATRHFGAAPNASQCLASLLGMLQAPVHDSLFCSHLPRADRQDSRRDHRHACRVSAHNAKVSSFVETRAEVVRPWTR